MLSAILTVSVLLQLLAAALALRLTWLTGWRRAWALVCLAICGMAARRIVSLLNVLSGQSNIGGGLTAELVALGISIAMLVGLAWIGPPLKRTREAEQRIRESEARYRAMIEAFDGLVYICDQHYRVEYMNPALIKRTGYDGTGDLCYKVLHDRDAPCPWCPNEHIWNGETVHWEVQSPKDGRYYLVTNTPLTHADGRVSKQAMIIDITERREQEREIQRLKQQFSKIIEGVEHVDIHGVDADGRIVYWSRGAELLYGYSKDEAIGQDICALLIPESLRGSTRQIIRDAFDSGQCPPPMEFMLYDREGTAVPIFCDHAMVQSNGDPAELFCVAVDLRPLRAAQSAAAQSEERLQRLVDSTQDIITIHDANGRYVYCHGPERYGVQASDVVGQTPIDLLGPEEGGQLMEQMRDVIQTGEARTERNMVTWQGEELWFEDHIFPMRDEAGTTTGVGKICRNVTETVRAEANLARRDRILEAVTFAAERFFREDGWDAHVDDGLARLGQAAEASRVYIVQVRRDDDGRPLISQRNEWVAEGITPQSDSPELQDVDCRNSAFRRWAEALHRGEAIVGRVADFPAEERAMLEPQGIVSLAAVPIFAGTELWGMIGFDDCHDARDWPAAEIDALRIAADILGGAIHHERLAEHLLTVNKLESIGVLAGGIAHDFNNILTAIAGNVSLARLGGIDPEDMADMLSEAEQACTRARDLVRQLMTFSKGAAPRPERVDLAALLKEITAGLQRDGLSRVELQSEKPLWPVEIDRDQIAQAVRNILANARQATPPEQTPVKLRAENVTRRNGGLALTPGRYVRITVSDSGEGIAPTDMAKIFDPYFTTHANRSGLGLSAAYAIVKKHGGAIDAQSKPGEGSRFDIYLPAGQMPEVSEKYPSAAASHTPSNRRRVLIMDDESQVRHVVSRMLERMGYEVTTTTDGAQAVDAYRHAIQDGGGFDLVILDLMVPGGVGGQQAAAEILAEDAGARIVVASGYSETPILARPGEYGFCGHIAKPFELKDLQQVVEEALDGA
ncbi:MAG: PAS domain S-box protein [Phycisphaerae bacterium]|nr:PAS domain S-box protein [Phycisphaerae bacterium]